MKQSKRQRPSGYQQIGSNSRLVFVCFVLGSVILAGFAERSLDQTPLNKAYCGQWFRHVRRHAGGLSEDFNDRAVPGSLDGSGFAVSEVWMFGRVDSLAPCEVKVSNRLDRLR